MLERPIWAPRRSLNLFAGARVVSRAGLSLEKNLWLNGDVIYNRMNPLHLTYDLLRPIFGLESRCHAGEIDGVLDGFDAYLSHSLERTVRGEMRLNRCRDGRVVNVVPRGLGIRLASDSEKGDET